MEGNSGDDVDCSATALLGETPATFEDLIGTALSTLFFRDAPCKLLEIVSKFTQYHE